MKITKGMQKCFKITLDRFLNENDIRYICLALPPNHKDYCNCKNYISDAIKTEKDSSSLKTLSCWLTEKLEYQPKHADVRKHRIEWLKRLSQGIH